MGGGGAEGGTSENTILPYKVPYIQLRQLVSETDCQDFFVEYHRKYCDSRDDEKKCRFELRDGKVVSGDQKLRLKLKPPLR